ncbi:MAG: hypothetical protein ACJ75J_02105 [Cytophagaceae bacterium]
MIHFRIRKIIIALVFGLAAFLVLDSCTKNKGDRSKRAFIDRPFKDLAPAEQSLTVSNTDSSQTFNLKGGTVISIPDHAFVDEKGNPVSGKVDIKYSEFHTAADIIVSGIPMTYDSAGTTGNFQTAGMFRIQGYQDGKPVFIAKDKKIDIQMGSFVRGDEYNLYYLDTNARNWDYLGHGTLAENAAKKKDSIAAELPKKPIEPKEYDDKTPVFDINVNLKDYPELKEFKGLVWQYSGSDPKQNPENNKWIYGFHWKKVTVEPYNLDSSQFKLLLDNGKTKFESIVTPVLAGKNLDKAREHYKKKMEKYQAEIAKVNKLREFQAREAEVLRPFRISTFGIYNCDQLFRFPGAVMISASFDVEGLSSETMDNPKIYLITGDDRTVVKYDIENLNSFIFTPTATNKLVYIAQDMSVAIYSSQDFKNIDIQKIKDNKAFKFQLIPTGKKIASTTDLQNIITSL